MVELTCINHPTGVWSTKNPWFRSIHWIGWDRDEGTPSGADLPFDVNRIPNGFSPFMGCLCPFTDLRWVDGEGRLNPLNTAQWEVDYSAACGRGNSLSQILGKIM